MMKSCAPSLGCLGALLSLFCCTSDQVTQVIHCEELHMLVSVQPSHTSRWCKTLLNA